jgi:hypothetical protein
MVNDLYSVKMHCSNGDENTMVIIGVQRNNLVMENIDKKRYHEDDYEKSQDP